MPHAARPSAVRAKMQTTRSSWTPLNHPLSNSKVFEERRQLLAKWFDRWSDSQRLAVLQDFVSRCSVDQLTSVSLSVSRRLPLRTVDFTCLLPRALSLYLFSYLDPRSLCRCARVSWHWKSIVDLDQLWMPKCLRLGWCIDFSPTPFEQGVWKRHYIQTVQELRLNALQIASSQQQQSLVPDVSTVSSGQEHLSEEERPVFGTEPLKGFSKKKHPAAPPPWRDSDRHPKDTLRFNYLDNMAPGEQDVRGAVKNTASSCRANMWNPDVCKRKTASEANYKLRKAKSLMFLSSNSRPQHPPHHLQDQSGPSWSSLRDPSWAR